MVASHSGDGRRSGAPQTRGSAAIVSGVVSVLVAGVLIATGSLQTPPIFHPGAPGAPTRTITAEQALVLSRTSFTADDVAFMQHMLVHHAQAVEMVALLEAQGADPVVKRLGQRIAMSQEAEMGVMRGWLTDRGQPLDMPGMAHGGHSGHAMAGHVMASPAMAGHDMAGHDMAGHDMASMPTGEASDQAVMPGMLSPRQMQALAAAQGPAFDKLFLAGMIQHHQGALDMVDALLADDAAAQDPVLSDFTTSVVADQSAEILRMQSVLSGL